MNHTLSHQLPQWVESGRVLMEDFKDMVTAIDVDMSDFENCQIASGVYTGNRSRGAAPNVLSFAA